MIQAAAVNTASVKTISAKGTELFCETGSVTLLF